VQLFVNSPLRWWDMEAPINDSGENVLMHAAAHGEYEIVAWLLKQGADVRKQSDAGETARDLAAASENPARTLGALDKFAAENTEALVKSLRTNSGLREAQMDGFLKGGADLSHVDEETQLTPLGLAVKNGIVEATAKLLENNAPTHHVHPRTGHDIIHTACDRGHFHVVDLLIHHGADIQATTVQFEMNCLHLAAMNGRNGIAQIMLQAGTNPNAKDWEGETALLKFARQVYGSGTGQSDLIKLFIAKGADLDVRDKDGHSALYYAIDHNQVAASRLLISAGADASSIVRKVNQHGETASVGAFEMAVSSGAHDVALWLVKDGHAAQMMFKHTALKGTKAMALTPIYAALTQGWEDVGIALVESDVDKTLIDAKNKDGATPLHIASMKGHTKAVEALIAAGADVDAANQNGETALFRAADRGHRDVVLQLIKGGANLEAKDRGDNTALFKAAAKGHAAAASALLEHGANKEAKGFAAGGKKGGQQAKMASLETPAQCAERHGFIELAQYIRDFTVKDRDL